MAANLLKSKLKRQKTLAYCQQSDVSPREALSRSRSLSPVTPGPSAAETERLVVPAVSWWNQEPLSVVEGLWAVTVTSALQDLHNHLVPELPQPSALKPTAAVLDQQWCDLSQELAPFPEPPPPSPPSSSPELPGCTHQQPSTETTPAPVPPKSQPHHREKTRPLGVFGSRALPPAPRGREGGAAARAGPSGVGGEERRKEREHRVKRQLVTEQRRAPEQHEGGSKGQAVEEEEAQNSSGDAAAGGGGGLQSCPMCLLVFPAGFTQMDRDGHLAQCLSEVNMDVTW